MDEIIIKKAAADLRTGDVVKVWGNSFVILAVERRGKNIFLIKMLEDGYICATAQRPNVLYRIL